MRSMDGQRAKTQVVVLQPTPFCNMNCHYCYLPGRNVFQMMRLDVLERTLEALFSSSFLAQNVTLLWHAGEPLVVPLHFYREAFRLLQRFNTRGITVTSSFQTNGTRITQQWCDFIKLYNISIGVSLDGPQHLHDRSRVDWAGKGTFERTMHGVQLLQENDIEPVILIVLTKDALDYPDEMWQFLCDYRLTKVAFNVEEVNGAHTSSSLNGVEDVQRYKRFLWRLLELRSAVETPPIIREIDTFLKRIDFLVSPVFSQENMPGSILSVDYMGNVSTFASELLTMTDPRHGNFLLGNLLGERLEEIFARPKFLSINAEVQKGVARCRQSCPYFDFCGGGSPVNKLSEHGTFDATETLCCKLKIQATLDTLVEYLER